MPYKIDRIIDGVKWKWVTQFTSKKDADKYADRTRRSMGWNIRVVRYGKNRAWDVYRR